MPDKYFLTQRVIGCVQKLDLNLDEFCRIKKSRDILSAAINLEQVYDFYASGLLDFERELLSISAEDMLRGSFTTNYFYDIGAAVGRRLGNLLSNARGYFDQAPRHFARCMGDKMAAKTARCYMNVEYDSNVNYRVMEAVRNHVQHQDVGIISNTLGGRRDPETRHLAHTVSPFISGHHLLNSRKTKASVRPDIKEKMDVRLLVRSYSESISKIHCRLRSDAKDAIDGARVNLDGWVEKYLHYGGSPAGLVAQFERDDRQIEYVPIVPEWDDTRIWLTERNRSLGDYVNHYVSGRIGG